MKSPELEIRPLHHRLEDRVRAHVFLCMLAYAIRFEMEARLAPLLFKDDAPLTPVDPVAPTQRSAAAKRKAATKRKRSSRKRRCSSCHRRRAWPGGTGTSRIGGT